MAIAFLAGKYTRPQLDRIANAIRWENLDGALIPYPAWTSLQKKALAAAYERISGGQTMNLPAAPPLAADFPPTATAWTVLTPQLAWRYFVSYVAQSLVFDVSLRPAGASAWSLTGYSDAELAQLLDSQYLIKCYFYLGNYVIDPDYILGAATPGDPVRIYRFLAGKHLIGNNALATIQRVLSWCRSRLLHYSGGSDIANVVDQWQYAGVPPVERMLAGTIQTSNPGQGRRNRTMGCTGTTGFLRTLLRTVNIPVEQLKRCHHALVHFLRPDRYLSHGDDPYGGLAEATPPIPISALPITPAKFTEWFDLALPEAEICKNVGRRPLELAVQCLPNYLLHLHCADLNAGHSHAASHVAGVFQGVFSVVELEAQQLWSRMDARIAALGGCANIPPVTYGT